MKNIADSLISDILFWTTMKGDIPHYLFILRNPDKFGTNLKNSVCSRLETMLQLEIQKGEEAMKTFYFQ